MEFVHQAVGIFLHLIDLFLHLDVYLNQLVVDVGNWIYPLLFLVIFCETGLVVTPILPGDSLLFAIGALSSIEGSPLNLPLLGVLLVAAAVLGDACNYLIGKHLGPAVFKRKDSWLLNKKHLEQAHAFYERHGGKTIILARFVPIVRTFAPFVAGIGGMKYRRFALYNLAGAALWVPPLLTLGYFMGNIPAVKTNFHIVVVVIVLISVAPGVVEFLRARREGQNPPDKTPAQS